jgi:hypothetical protein
MSDRAFRTPAEPSRTPVMHMEFPGARFLRVDVQVDQVRIGVDSVLPDGRSGEVGVLVGKRDALRIAGAILKAVTMLPDDELADDDVGIEVESEDK